MSFWIKNLVAGSSIRLTPTTNLRISNVALSCEYKDALGRTSLVLSPPQTTNFVTPYTIVNLIPLHIEQFRLDMKLVRGQTYILSCRGLNDLTLLGYYEETFLPASASVSQQSATGAPSILSQPPSLPDTGDNDTAPPSVVTRSHITPAVTVSNTLGLVRSPFEATQQHANSTAPTPPSRVVTPGIANNSNPLFSFNFQHTKSSDPVPATDNSSFLENQQHHPSQSSNYIPPNLASRDLSHSMTVQNAHHPSSGIAGPAPSMPQAELNRKVADGSSDASQKQRMTTNRRAPQLPLRSSHPSSHPMSGQQLSSGPPNGPGRRTPQSALKSSYPSYHLASGHQHSSGLTNEPGRLYPPNPSIPTDARSVAAPAPSMLQPELKQRVAGGSNDRPQESGSTVESHTFTPQPSSRPMSSQQVSSDHTDSHMTVDSPVPSNAPLPLNTAPGATYLLAPGANLPMQSNTGPIAPAPVPPVNPSPALQPSSYPMTSQRPPSGHTNSRINVKHPVNSDAPFAPGATPGRPAPN